jgi:hypothetical protein
MSKSVMTLVFVTGVISSFFTYPIYTIAADIRARICSRDNAGGYVTVSCRAKLGVVTGQSSKSSYDPGGKSQRVR